MNMYAEEIYTAACAICGEESDLLGLLSTAASEELEYRMSPDVQLSDISETFIAASALLAVSMYAQSKACGSESISYRAGEVTVNAPNANERESSSGALRRQAEMLMARYLRDDDFWFSGVDG